MLSEAPANLIARELNICIIMLQLTALTVFVMTLFSFCVNSLKSLRFIKHYG